MRVILSEEEFKKSWGWHGFNDLDVPWPKLTKSCQLLPLYNFAYSEIHQQ
jgi:hypothetical protein